jgi:predicted Rossmann-fold nucleotide-binding protein
VIVAIQTGKMAHVPLILYGSAFWDGLFDWIRQGLLQAGMIDPYDLELLALIDEPSEIAALITASLGKIIEGRVGLSQVDEVNGSHRNRRRKIRTDVDVYRL